VSVGGTLKEISCSDNKRKHQDIPHLTQDWLHGWNFISKTCLPYWDAEIIGHWPYKFTLLLLRWKLVTSQVFNFCHIYGWYLNVDFLPGQKWKQQGIPHLTRGCLRGIISRYWQYSMVAVLGCYNCQTWGSPQRRFLTQVTNKTGSIQLGGERMLPPESCFEKDTRKTIVRGGYVLIFNTWRDQDFVDLRMGSTEIWLMPASSIKR